MSALSSDILVTPQDLFSQTANVDTTVPYNTGTPQLGVRAVTGDGREFRYAQAGATALVAGDLQQAPAQIAAFNRMTPAAASAGDTSVSVTTGATALTENEFLGGWLVVEDDSSNTGGYQYQVKSNPAADASTAGVVIQLNDALVDDISTSAHVSLAFNPYKGVIVNPTTATSSVVGVAIIALTASYYGWIQTRGVGTILSQGGTTVGDLVVASNGTAGAVETAVSASTEAQAPVGTAYHTLTTTDFGLVNITSIG